MKGVSLPLLMPRLRLTTAFGILDLRTANEHGVAWVQPIVVPAAPVAYHWLPAAVAESPFRS